MWNMRRKIVKVFSYYHINLEHSKNAPKILKCVTAVRRSDLRQVIKFRPFLKFCMGSFEVCGLRLKLFTIYSLTLKSYERSFRLSEHLAFTLYTRHASLAVSGLELACCLSGWRLELEKKIRENFTNMEKCLLRHYAKQMPEHCK